MVAPAPKLSADEQGAALLIGTRISFCVGILIGFRLVVGLTGDADRTAVEENRLVPALE